MNIVGHARDQNGNPTVIEGSATRERHFFIEDDCQCIKMQNAGIMIFSDCLCNGKELRYDHSSADLS